MHISEQPFIQLWTLPPELSDTVSLSELPLLGASPDGLLDADPMADSASGSMLELKSKAQFSHFRKQWRSIDESTPGTEIDAAHFAQAQLEMLVTGKSQQSSAETSNAVQHFSNTAFCVFLPDCKLTSD